MLSPARRQRVWSLPVQLVARRAERGCGAASRSVEPARTLNFFSMTPLIDADWIVFKGNDDTSPWRPRIVLRSKTSR